MKINVMEFANNASLGNIYVGMHVNEIIEILGNPNKTNTIDANKTLQYFDDFELLFEGELLIAIQNEKTKSDKIDDAINKLSSSLNADSLSDDELYIETNNDVSLQDIKCVLNKHKLPFSEIEEEKGKTITFKSGAYMTFKDETIEDDMLFVDIPDQPNPDNSQVLRAIGHSVLK